MTGGWRDVSSGAEAQCQRLRYVGAKAPTPFNATRSGEKRQPEGRCYVSEREKQVPRCARDDKGDGEMFPQGLKPNARGCVMSELKLRPPETRRALAKSASLKAAANVSEGEKQVPRLRSE